MNLEMKLRHALVFYVILSIFPGCLCVHFLRIVAVSDSTGLVLLGTIVMVAPFVLLAFTLIVLAKRYSTLNVSQTYFWGSISLLGIASIISLTYFVNSTFQLNRDFSNDSLEVGWDSAFGSQLISGWFIAFAIGLIILLIGVYRHNRLPN